MIGIYKITSPSGKIYIGQSINIKKRFNDYKLLMSKSQKLLHRSFLKYGVINHTFEIIEECIINQLNEKERYWQDYYDVMNRTKGLNLTLTQSELQYKVLSEESKKLISIKNSGKIRTEENKIKTSNSLKKYYETNTHHIKGFKRGTCNNKLNSEQVIEIRQLLLNRITVLEISKLFNVSQATIQQIKQGRTWQSLGEFKLEGKVSRLKQKDLSTLYILFDKKLPVKEIQKIIPYSTATIAKQRKIWKKIKESDQK